MQALTSVNQVKLQDPGASLLTALDLIKELREYLKDSDLLNSSEREQLGNNVSYIKTFYERAERQVRDRLT